MGLALSGQIKPAVFKIATRAVEAQKHQMSYGQFSRALTVPTPAKQMKNRN
jgi:hypothetical protein